MKIIRMNDESAAPVINPVRSGLTHLAFTVSLWVACVVLLFGMSAYPAAAQTATPSPQDVYIDNRSGAAELITSFVNALNRHEYLRAYSYWDEQAATNGKVAAYPDFKKGYADTQSVQLTIGAVGSDAGAGQLYFNVPVTLLAQLANGTTQTFVGCYTLHLSQPAIQAMPPFHPLAIVSAQVQQYANNISTTDLMSKACPDSGNPPAEVAATVDPANIDIARYIDDRSDPVQELRSLFNAINRHEYVRAYSYWDESAVTDGKVPAFADFQKGYENTENVTLVASTPIGEGAAGQVYYHLPVTITSQTNGTTQTFVGCYLFRLAQPSIQDTPPFHPFTILSGTLKQVNNGTDTASLMAQSCTNQ